MAVEWQLDEEEEEGAPSSGSGSEQQIGGAPAIISGADQQPSDSPETSSGSYTNLQKYIEANKGREFGEQVAGKIEGGVQEGVQKLGERESEFRSGVDANKLDLTDDLRQKITDTPQALSEDEKGQAKRIRTASYEGPENFSGGVDNDPYAQLRQYFGGLEDEQKAIQTTGGQGVLLDKYYNRPDYTTGQKSLDTYLLSQDQAPIDRAKESLSGAINQYGQKRTELDEYAKSAKEKSKVSQDAYRALLGLDQTGNVNAYRRGEEQEGLIQKDMARLEEKAAKRQDESRKILADAKAAGRDLRQPGASVYGGMPGVNNLWGLDPTKYLNMVPEGDINYQRTASPDDLARFSALSELAGMEQGYLDPSLVGTLDDEALYNFDAKKLASDADIRRQNYEGTVKDTIVRTPERLAQTYGMRPNESLEKVLEEGKSGYDEAKSYLQQYPDTSLDPNAAFRKSGLIDPYEQLLKQREDLRKQYGYYDLITR